LKKVGVYGHTFLQASAQIPYKFVDGQRIFVHCVYEAAYGYEREFSSVRPRLMPWETWILIHVNAQPLQ
jgi:hypothetical protein